MRGHLRQQMTERGLDISDLARRCGVSPSGMNRILWGGRGVGLGLVVRIARNLHINPTRLLLEEAPERFRDDAQAPEPSVLKKKK